METLIELRDETLREIAEMEDAQLIHDDGTPFDASAFVSNAKARLERIERAIAAGA